MGENGKPLVANVGLIAFKQRRVVAWSSRQLMLTNAIISGKSAECGSLGLMVFMASASSSVFVNSNWILVLPYFMLFLQSRDNMSITNDQLDSLSGINAGIKSLYNAFSWYQLHLMSLQKFHVFRKFSFIFWTCHLILYSTDFLLSSSKRSLHIRSSEWKFIVSARYIFN